LGADSKLIFLKETPDAQAKSKKFFEDQPGYFIATIHHRDASIIMPLQCLQIKIFVYRVIILSS
jgi:hypothetical protein